MKKLFIAAMALLFSGLTVWSQTTGTATGATQPTQQVQPAQTVTATQPAASAQQAQSGQVDPAASAQQTQPGQVDPAASAQQAQAGQVDPAASAQQAQAGQIDPVASAQQAQPGQVDPAASAQQTQAGQVNPATQPAAQPDLQKGYYIEVQPDKKIIHIRHSFLPENIIVKDLLAIIPELLHREGDELYPNYDVQFDGKSVGASRDVFLLETRLYELSTIEITNWPDVTFQRNGQGGVINLKPAKLQEGFGSNVYLDVTTEPNIVPGINLNYKKGKFEMRSRLNMEFYNPRKNQIYSESNKDDGLFKQGTDYSNVKDGSETAKIDLVYSFSDKDILKAWIIESWEGVRTETQSKKVESQKIAESLYRVDTTITNTLSDKNDLLVNVMGEYQHLFNPKKFPKDKLTLNASYQYKRNEGMETISQPNGVTGELKYEGTLLTLTDHLLKIKTGMNAKYNFGSAQDKVASEDDSRQNDNLYLSPYLEFKYTYKTFQINLGARYQHYDRSFSTKTSQTYDYHDNDVTATLNMLYQIVPHHALKLVGARNLLRPTDVQLYPEMFWNTSKKMLQVGNPDLKNAYIYNVELSYITDWKENGHSIVFNFAIGYNYSDGVIESVILQADPRFIPVTTFVNQGVNNVLTTNAMLLYSYGIFSFAFTGNVYHNHMLTNGQIDRYTYFNLNLSPVFKFNKGWTLNGNFRYNSAIVRTNSIQGDCFFADLRLNKRIGDWDVYLLLSDIFDYTCSDYKNTNGTVFSNMYDLYTRYVGVGFNYRFGNLRSTTPKVK